MTKKSAPNRRPVSRARKQQKRSDRARSIVIPAVVGVVLVAIIVGAIALNESRQAAAAATTPDIDVPVVTVAPQATQPIPFPNVRRSGLTETQELLGKGQAVLIDVRSGESFNQGHAAGALSFPEEEIASRLTELPRDKQLILYCT